MRLMISIVCGLVGGAVGAAIWAAVAHYTNHEVGWIAWGVGVLVGLGMAIAAGEDKGLLHGIIAAVIALASVGVGKYVAVHMALNQFVNEVQSTHISYTDDEAQLQIARDLVGEYAEKGKEVKWPAGKDAESAEAAEDFPKDLLADAKRRWDAMNPGAKADYKDQLAASVRQDLAAAVKSEERGLFQASFTAWDLLWAFLAVGSAFRIGAGVTRGGGDN